MSKVHFAMGANWSKSDTIRLDLRQDEVGVWVKNCLTYSVEQLKYAYALKRNGS